MPIQQAGAAFDAAVAANDESTIIDALYHRHPALLGDALKSVAQRRIKAAMPRLIEMHAWLNTPDGGPVWTGSGTYWDEMRDHTTIELSDEVVAAVSAITAKAIPPPKDHSYTENQRYLNDVKAWWQANK